MKLAVQFQRTISTVVTVTVIATVLWQLVPRIHAQQGNTMVWQNPAKVIDEKARALNPDDSNSVQGLADAVFSYPHVLGRLPMDMENAVKARAIDAETKFLKGNRPGVQEEDVAKAVNLFADRLRLPDYARTSPKQVRALRMSLVVDSPMFMGRGMARPSASVGDSISSEMSPLQALHVAMVMINQKTINPDFQVTPEEWDRGKHTAMVEQIKQIQALQKSAKSGQTTHHIITRQNPKHDEMRQALSDGLSSMTLGDGVSFADEALKTLKLGIAGKERTMRKCWLL